MLSNPVRMRVMQHLYIHQKATTRQISEDLSDIPLPSLYRHINAMLKADLLMVLEERKVRGSTERLLSINHPHMEAATNASISSTAFQFFQAMYMDFERYSRLKNADPYQDRLGIRTRFFTLTDHRYDELIHQLRTVMDQFQEKDEGGKLRSLSLISAPVTEDIQ